MHRIAFFILFTATFSGLFGQTNYCGTQQTEEDLTWLRNFQQNYSASDARGGSNYFIPLKIHIVGTDEGGGYYALSYLWTAICELNERYTDVGFTFYVYGDIDYINESDFYEHDWFDGSDMMDENNVNDLVNVYFVADPAGNCGYFSPSDDGVAIAKSCAMPNGTTIAHELGHFFSLPHTFYGWEWGTPDDEDQEWVNGDNCNSAADGFCDTPPDYLSYRWNCPGPLETDPHGETFYSDGSLYMGYADDACTSRFSEEQMDAMVANLLGPRNDLLDYPEPVYSDIESTPILVEPADDAIGIYSNYAVFKWTATPGATQYHLQVSYSPSFTAIAVDMLPTDTVAVITTLEPDKFYYWRVKPLAPLNYCEAYTLGNSFSTNLLLSSVEENNLLGDYSISPNPIAAGEELSIQYSAERSFEGSVQLFDLTGKEITGQKLNIVNGVNNFSLFIPKISQGIYVLVITDGIKSETSKILVN